MKTIKKNIDYFNRWVAIIALLLSIGNIAYELYKDKRNRQEIVRFYYSSFNLVDPVVITQTDFDFAGKFGLVPMNYGIVIANNSNNKISIVEMQIESQSNTGIRYFLGMIDGFYNNNNTKLEFPVVLDSGESINIIIKLRQSISEQVFDVLNPVFDFPCEVMFSELNTVLIQNKIDIFGNPFEYNASGTLVLTKKTKYPDYRIIVRTANNNKFSNTFSLWNYIDRN